MYPLSGKAMIVIASFIVLDTGAITGHAILIIVGFVGVIGPFVVWALKRLDNWLWPPTTGSREWNADIRRSDEGAV